MSRPDVLYCIEHVARELNIASAVRTIAREKHGLDVHIHVLSSPFDPSLQGHSPGLITIPFCTSRRFVPRAVLKTFPDVPVVNLAYEQLLSRGNRRYRLPKDDLPKKLVTHAAAGDFYREWLIQAGVRPENIEVVGSMPFQMYREPYRRFFDSRRESLAQEHGLDPNRPWVLLPENFGAAFFTAATMRKRLRGGYVRKELRAYVDYQRRAFRHISRWCAAAASVGEVELIVRPRPAISNKLFTEAFYKASEQGPQERLHIIKEGTIQEWIFASQLVVSSYSTTLLEAAVAGRPSFMLSPLATPPSAASEWHSSARVISSRDGFVELVNAPQRALPADGLQRWAEKNLLSRGDAVENVAALCAAICSGQRAAPTPSQAPFRKLAVNMARDALSWPERFLRHKLRPGRRQVFGHECDAIERQAIDQLSQEWTELLVGDRQVHAA